MASQSRHRWWHRGPFVRREVRLSVGTLLVFLFVFYVALPLLASHRAEVNSLAHINIGYLALGVLLEVGALVAYTQLTHAVLPHGGPRRLRLVPHQHVHPGPQPRLPRRHGPGCSAGLPTAHPVRGERVGRRIRPRDPGHRISRGPQRDVLVLAGRLPRDPRLSCPLESPRGPVGIGFDSGHRGRRHRGGPAGRLREPVLSVDPGPGAGEPAHPAGRRAHPLPRRRSNHRPGRAVGRSIRRPHAGPVPHPTGHRVGRHQLAARRRLALGVRCRLQSLRLAHRPAHGLRAGQHPGRHPRHPGRARRCGVRPGVDDHRVRPDHRPGPLRRPGLPGRQLLAAHPLWRAGLRLVGVRAPSELRQGAAVSPPSPGAPSPGSRDRCPPHQSRH